MKFFLSICTIGAFLLFCTIHRPHPPALERPFVSLKKNFIESFEKKRNATIAWAFISGDKKSIHYKTLKDFATLELSFLLSPSGLHLAGFLYLIRSLVKLFALKRRHLISMLELVILGILYFLPFTSLKRLILFRFFWRGARLIKYPLSFEILFYLTFFTSFFLGHFKDSPLSFSLSFLFMGTILAFRDRTRLSMLLALVLAHFISALFLDQKIAIIALFINLPFLWLFSLLMPLLYLYLLSNSLWRLNWLEPFMNIYLNALHFVAKFLNGSKMDASLLMIVAVWLILYKGPKWAIALCFLFHANDLGTPAIFLSHG